MFTKSAAKRSISIVLVFTFIFSFLISSMPVRAENYTMYNVNYSAGDVDNIVGSSTFSLAVIAGTSFEFSSSSRFSRKGYKLVSWYIPSTGETVAPNQSYVMPYHDIDVIANWKAETYNISFAGVGGTTAQGDANFYLTATYGDTITLPESPFTYDGYEFSGWKYNGVVYNAGDEFAVPAVLTGEKIVISAVWTKKSSVTTTAVTTQAITTATTVSTTTVLEEGQIIKTYEVNQVLDTSSVNVYKAYIYRIINKDDTIEKLLFNFSADCENIGQVSMAFGTNLTNSTWYQKDFAEIIEGNKFSVDLADAETCALLNYFTNVQVGFWYGETNPITLDSITAIVREPEITTTETSSEETIVSQTTVTTVTTTVETTTETTAETTSSETTPSVITSTETTTATTESSISSVTLKPSQYSKVIDINDTLYRGSIVQLKMSDFISTNQIVESIEIKLNANENVFNNYTFGMYMNLSNYGTLYFNATDYMASNILNLQIQVDENQQEFIDKNSIMNLGYYWGDGEEITIESITINYRIDKGDYNSDGVVDLTDAEMLRQFMIGADKNSEIFTFENSDINGDNSINIFDYMILTRTLN